MIVSNSPQLRVGEGFRAPGKPVPEFAAWSPTVQTRMLRLRRVVDVSEDVAERMLLDHQEKLEQAARGRKEAQLRDLQARAKGLHRQLRTSKDDTTNKERLLDEVENEMLAKAEELGINVDELELFEAEPPKVAVPVSDRPDPQRLADELADISDLDIRNLAAERFGLELADCQPREALVGLLFAHVYGLQTSAPKPTEPTGRALGLNQGELDADRETRKDELEAMTVPQLRDLAKEVEAPGAGNKAELVEAIMVAEEKAAVQSESEDPEDDAE